MKQLYARMEYPNNGHAIDQKHVSLIDSTQFYEVEDVKIYSSSSSVTLKQFTYIFNTVNFTIYERVEDEKTSTGEYVSYDIFADPELNKTLLK